MDSKKSKTVDVHLRITPAEAVQLDAIARQLGITKSEVLRLSLSASGQRRAEEAGSESGRRLRAIAETGEAVFSRLGDLVTRVENVEAVASDMAALLLSISSNLAAAPQSADRRNEGVTPAPTNQNSAAGGSPRTLPRWSEYVARHPKTNLVMSDADWLSFVRGRYEKQFGTPPDTTT